MVGFMGNAGQVYQGDPYQGYLRALGLPPKLGSKSYGSPHSLSIHFCSQSLHLWVTASTQNLVYRELIRKYFGTEIMHGAEVDNGCRFLGRTRECGSSFLERASV
jgi:hypothetical protein